MTVYFLFGIVTIIMVEKSRKRLGCSLLVLDLGGKRKYQVKTDYRSLFRKPIKKN